MYIKPSEKGNAQVLNEICLPITPALTLLRYEAIANFYSEEPQHIYVKLREGDERSLFEQVFRLRFRIPNKIAYSWMIYSNSREWFNEDGGTKGLILRHVVWNRSEDSERIKQVPKSNREELLSSWPQIYLETVYLNPQLATDIITVLLEGDKFLSKGIVINERPREAISPEWRDIEIRRLFYWGNVEALWTPDMENSVLEEYCFKLHDIFSSYMNKAAENICEMSLDYIYPPEEYKKVVYGVKGG